MIKTRTSVIWTTVCALAAGAMAGCESLPGNRTQQATVMGSVAGGVTGATMNSANPLLGALIGGALGAGGGYLIGAKTDWFEKPNARDEARKSVTIAQDSPATEEDVRRSSTADLNRYGFVTTDELTAMDRAGLSDDEIIRRLEDTDQVFDLSSRQEDALVSAGVSRRVVREMGNINREERERILGSPRPRAR